jgi:hypothetical protein
MGHLCDILIIMFGFLVIYLFNRKLRIALAPYVGENTYNINYPLPACLSRIYPTQTY